MKVAARTEDGATYREPGRSYASAVVLFVVLLAGFGLDIGLGGGGAHWPGWLIAIVLVVGVDVITAHAARMSRSILLTAHTLSVGDTEIPRDRIMGIERDVDGSEPVLGRPRGTGLPRGTAGLAVHLVDGTTIVVPTRRPAQLSAALDLRPSGPEIRQAEEDEPADLAEIEQRASTIYRVGGFGELPAISFGERLATPIVVLVAGRPAVGFLRLEEVDGAAHVAGLSVLPGSMRRGVGSALLEGAAGWAAAHGFTTMTATAYAEIPWNAPFLERHGFEPLGDPTPALLELRDWERSQGLDRMGRRIVLRRTLR